MTGRMEPPVMCGMRRTKQIPIAPYLELVLECHLLAGHAGDHASPWYGGLLFWGDQDSPGVQTEER